MGSTAASTSSDTVGQVVKTIRFRRDRASKACEVCHTRKVRCDMTENFPCTNCRAFSLTCTPRKGRGKVRKTENSSQAAVAQAAMDAKTGTPTGANDSQLSTASSSPPKSAPAAVNEYVYYPSGVPRDISAAESKRTNRNGENVIVQPSPLMKSRREGAHFESDSPEDELVTAVLNECTARVFSPVCDADYFAAKAYGSFLTPSPESSDHSIELFFTYVHPTIPVLNRREFSEQYYEDRDKPSSLVRQAIWCVASRLTDHPGVKDSTGTSRRTSSIFYRRAKASFDVNYERDQANVICTAIISSSAVSNPLYFNNSAFYWIHLATTSAQAIGYHRKSPKYTSDEQRQQRRIWWTIYRRDVATSMAYGRPNMIRLEDCDVAMVTEDDFIGSETASDVKTIDPNTQTGIRVAYFLHSVRLHEISALIIRSQFTVSAEWSRQLNEIPDSVHCESASAEWVAQIPPQLRYNSRQKSMTTHEGYDYLRSLLHLEYYTVISSSHRQQIALLFKGLGNRNAQQSAAVAFQSTHMISKIMINFREHGEIRKLPGSVVYTLFCAVFMLSFQRRSGPPGSAVDKAAEEGLKTFRDIARESAKSHSAASWVALLADDLQSEKSTQCISKSMRKVNVENAHRMSQNGNSKSHLDSPNSISGGYMGNYMNGYGYTNGSRLPSVVHSRSETPLTKQPPLSQPVIQPSFANSVPQPMPQTVPPSATSQTGVSPVAQPGVVASVSQAVSASSMTPNGQQQHPITGDKSMVSTPNGVSTADSIEFARNRANNPMHIEAALNPPSMISAAADPADVLPTENGVAAAVTGAAAVTPSVQAPSPVIVPPTKEVDSADIFPHPASLSFDSFPPEQIPSYLTPDFPTNSSVEFSPEHGEDVPSNTSSGDEVPDSMSMADWYAFLNNDNVMGANDVGATELGDLAM